MIRIIRPADPFLSRLLAREPANLDEIKAAVADIIKRVRQDGDRALCDYTEKFGGPALEPGELKVTDDEIESALTSVDGGCLAALEKAANNISGYHQKQLFGSWFEPGENGKILGQLVRPLARVGIYVPGGTASYPSSVLMNALPARVAGVPEIVMTTPPGPDGRLNPYTLAAARLAGVTEIYRVGGAQAVAALAYGTETIRPVDKITGPGNIYVTMAKQQVYGKVDIDMLAGPSEILVIADDSAEPAFVAADLLSQAEHDALASAVLITPHQPLALEVQRELKTQLARLPRQDLARASLEEYGAVIVTDNLEQAFDLANELAPEHLELMVREPFHWLGRVCNAGAVFLGPYTPEPVGDYMAGPNHVLPTGGTARFYSPLGVQTFLKRTSVVYYSPAALEKDGPEIIRLAGVEGLDAHACSVKVRLAGPGGKTAAQAPEANENYPAPGEKKSINGCARMKPQGFNGFPEAGENRLDVDPLPGMTPYKRSFGSLPGKSASDLRSGTLPGINNRNRGDNDHD
ncbi:MAG: histidinol dehydrogenase [Bacillota bacterium]